MRVQVICNWDMESLSHMSCVLRGHSFTQDLPPNWTLTYEFETETSFSSELLSSEKEKRILWQKVSQFLQKYKSRVITKMGHLSHQTTAKCCNITHCQVCLILNLHLCYIFTVLFLSSSSPGRSQEKSPRNVHSKSSKRQEIIEQQYILIRNLRKISNCQLLWKY